MPKRHSSTGEATEERVLVPQIHPGRKRGVARRGGLARDDNAHRIVDETERALGGYENLVRATEVVSAVLRRQLDSFGLTMGQFRILEALLCSGPMIQAALCERLLIDNGNASFIVGNLEKRGLIYRRAHRSDERSKTICLAPEGRKLIEGVFPLYAGLVRAMMGELTQREQDALSRICGKLGGGGELRVKSLELRVRQGLEVES